MNIKYASLILVGIFAAQTSQASITLQMQVGPLRNSLGGIIPNNTTLVLVSDTNGFSNLNDLGVELNGINLTAGTTFGSGSRILQVIGASDLNSNEFGYSTTLSKALLAQTWLCSGFQDLLDQHPKTSLLDNLLGFTDLTPLMQLLMVEVRQLTP
jgi:hypothetical protein